MGSCGFGIFERVDDHTSLEGGNGMSLAKVILTESFPAGELLAKVMEQVTE